MTLGKRFAIEVVVLYPTIYIHIYIPAHKNPKIILNPSMGVSENGGV